MALAVVGGVVELLEDLTTECYFQIMNDGIRILPCVESGELVGSR
jgi:hypothetical protein